MKRVLKVLRGETELLGSSVRKTEEVRKETEQHVTPCKTFMMAFQRPPSGPASQQNTQLSLDEMRR